MKRTLLLLTLCVAVVAMAFAKGPAGKGEEYHYALQYSFAHSADHALMLFNLASGPEYNKDLAVQHIAELGKSLEDARVFHSMVHKTYNDGSSKEINEEHQSLLASHNTAMELLPELKDAAAKGNIAKVKELGGEVYKLCSKALKADKDAVAKLKIAPLAVPN